MSSLMGNHPLGFLLSFCTIVIVSLGLVSFVSCVIAETKRSKTDDIKLDGKLCALPGNDAFGYGVAALTCLSVAQVVGNFVFCLEFCRRGKERKAKRPIIATIFVFFSWISFGIAIILIGVATTMSRTQQYGDGWLDGECYTVKDGIFICSGVLSLVTAFALLVGAIMVRKSIQVDQGHRVHAQIAFTS